MTAQTIFPTPEMAYLKGEDWAPVVRFIVPGRPQQRGSKQAMLIPKRGGGFVEKNGRPIVVAKDDNPKSKGWMAEVRDAAVTAWAGRELLACPVALSIEFFFKRNDSHYGSGRNAGTLKASAPTHHAQSPDLDKLVRAICDGLTGAIYRDDKLVCDYLAPFGRRWTTSSECASVAIYVPSEAQLPARAGA